nr:hypothetical protein [uncultured bacterium]
MTAAPPPSITGEIFDGSRDGMAGAGPTTGELPISVPPPIPKPWSTVGGGATANEPGAAIARLPVADATWGGGATTDACRRRA